MAVIVVYESKLDNNSVSVADSIVENLLYLVVGFVVTYLSMELASHVCLFRYSQTGYWWNDELTWKCRSIDFFFSTMYPRTKKTKKRNIKTGMKSWSNLVLCLSFSFSITSLIFHPLCVCKSSFFQFDFLCLIVIFY
jgi:hypothetical protein